jgi:hypothetical protein
VRPSPEKLPPGLKPGVLWGFFGTTEQAAEKGCILREKPEEHTSGAKAPLILLALCRG